MVLDLDSDSNVYDSDYSDSDMSDTVLYENKQSFIYLKAELNDVAGGQTMIQTKVVTVTRVYCDIHFQIIRNETTDQCNKHKGLSVD